ncbi:hypothetical protein BLSTO_01751 [Blastocystis sp. subtype 1]
MSTPTLKVVENPKAPTEKKEKTTWDKVKSKLMAVHLPIILLLAIGIGIFFPQPGIVMSKTPFSNFCVFMIFIISGIKLDTSSVKTALHYWPYFLMGLAIILLVTPFMGYLVLLIPLKTREMTVGIAVMCCCPTVLASAAILADQCGGNFALALLLSVMSNLLGVFISPVTTSLLFRSSGTSFKLDIVSLLIELLTIIALPMVIGYCAQLFIPAVARFAKRFSSLLKVLSSLFLCLVPWVKMSASSDKLKTMSLVDLALSIVIIIVVHYVFLLFTELVCKLTKSPTPITKSLALSCSMKTLPIAMTIISFLPPEVGSQGLMLLPAILFHFTQLINTSFLSVFWAAKMKKDFGEPEVEMKDIEAKPEVETKSVEAASPSGNAATETAVVPP